MPQVVPDPDDGLTPDQRESRCNSFFTGPWADEAESQAVLVRRCKHDKLFFVYEQQNGKWLQPPLHMERGQERPRIDVILTPTRKILDLGWTLGDVGIECKAPGVKLRRSISQALDYMRCTFILPNGRAIVLRQIFLWHLRHVYGDASSIMTQHRIGNACFSPDQTLIFEFGSTHLLRTYPDGDHLVRANIIKRFDRLGRKGASKG
jgi:hypothetical protein